MSAGSSFAMYAQLVLSLAETTVVKVLFYLKADRIEL